MHRFIILFLLIVLIDANSNDQNSENRQERNIDLNNWQSADALFKQFYLNENRQMETDYRRRVSGYPSRMRPVEGPINVEHIPAMLAARHVRRYPYSRRDDPAIIG
ncbi:unnamed protein product [Adineta steineri]|uniref:Uncharacterized protein n=1 Tax=Adineta steineri TaxID=433720 RepID=A0A819CXE5_9BILA|nr:unnamed protein product [Adineta steineri]